MYWKVNVDGTQAVINAAVANGVPKLVYTSSAGVVFNGNDLIDVDERLPGLEKAMDPYNESKAKAEEIVLAANGNGGSLHCRTPSSRYLRVSPLRASSFSASL